MEGLELLGDGWRRRFGVGTVTTFGRGGGGVDLALADDQRLHRHCGTIVVTDDGWELHNVGRWLRMRLTRHDRFGVDSVRPGESIRVPWTDTRVQIFVGDRVHEFTATRYGRQMGTPASVGGSVLDGRDDDATCVPVPVDRSAGYFRALVALCEPQLLDPTSRDVATDLQIALRLNRTGLERGRLSGKSIERRLDTCKARFGLKDVADGVASGLERRDSRRRLVELALLTATVTLDDLVVLAGTSDRAEVAEHI